MSELGPGDEGGGAGAPCPGDQGVELLVRIWPPLPGVLLARA